MRALLLSILLTSLSAVLTSCVEEERPAPNVKLLSTDIHVSVAQHTLTLPFIAAEDYAYRKTSFSLNRNRDNERARATLNQFLQDSTNPQEPLIVDGLTVVVRTYGWNDADMRQRQMCPMLTREWARSVCDNPWAAIQQALPVNRFRLVDMTRLQVGDPLSRFDCRDDVELHRPLPQMPGEAVMVCTAMVYGGRDDEFHHAVVRIDGDLGALWTVWRYGQNGETAEAMTEREAKAIAAFVRYAIGETEDFRELHSAMCQLRRPGSVDGPRGADCGQGALTSSGPNE